MGSRAFEATKLKFMKLNWFNTFVLSRSALNCMNVAAVLALKKVNGRPGSEASNCFLKIEFAATTWTRARIAAGRHNRTCQNKIRRTMIGNAMPNRKINAAGMRVISAA